jgi:pimeloyl-ACP methyl ester carboxylesterase
MGGQVATEVLARGRSGVRTAVLIGPPTNVAERNALLQGLRLAQSSVHESRQTRAMALSGYRETGPSWFARTLPDLLRYPIEDRIAQVQAPLLVLHGSRDAVCPPQWAQLLAGTAPHGRAVAVPGAAHAVIYDHGAEAAALIAEHARS